MDSKIFLGKYRVAADEMGSVGEIADGPVAYEAEEIASGKKVVVEVVPAASLKGAVRERLEAEASVAKKISHPNIPDLYDFGVEDDHLVYITEDFDGTLAEEWVNTHGPMPVGPVLRIASQVVSALGAAAFHRINHHALNPANLVLVPGQTAEGEWPLVKVLHFVGVPPKLFGTDGAVAAFDKSLHYASPEQVQKGIVDFRSELYSLGATMWFLLTGAPPLGAAAGATAAPPATNGAAAEKINAMPRKIRLLLAQMLAVNPETRPRDPLAFYRKLQDCLHQVERRETLARRFGIPAFSPSDGQRRRIPVKALTLAAVFLAIATAATLFVSSQLRHRRIVNAEEPIGKPIGVPEVAASMTPAPADTNAIASNSALPPAVAVESKNVPSAPPQDAELQPAAKPLPSADPAVIASTRQDEVTPAPPVVSNVPKDALSQEPASAAASVQANASPPVTDSRAVASNKQAGPVAGGSPPADTIASETESKKIRMHEVRRAEPADDEPEVRRAEPAPEDEGPESAAPETATSDSEPKVPEKSAAKKTERTAKPKRQTEKKDSRRERPSESPAGTRGARFLGLTPEGWRILELPSGKIIVVAPQRSSP